MISPKDYLERISFLNAVRLEKIDVEQVTDFLWLINARPDLVNLGIVVTNLHDALAQADTIWPSVLKNAGIEWLPELLRKMLPICPKQSSKNIPASSGAVKVTANRLNTDPHWYSRNALYEALCASRPALDDLHIKYRLLQAHFFLAHVASMRSNTNTSKTSYESYGDKDEWPNITISPRHAGIAIRSLKYNTPWANDLLNIMPLTKSPLDFAQHPNLKVEVINRYRIDSWTQDRPDYIFGYIRQVYGFKKRGVGWGSSAGREIFGVGDPEDPCFNFGDWFDWGADLDEPCNENRCETNGLNANHPPLGQNDSINAVKEGNDKHSEQLSADNCPDEDYDDSLGSWEPNEKSFQSSPGSFGGALRSIGNQVIREGKTFVFGYESLSARELSGLDPCVDSRLFILLSELYKFRNRSKAELRAYSNAYHQRAQVPFSTDIEAETLLFLAVMLWTGSSIERTYSLRRVESAVAQPESDLEIITNQLSGKDAQIRVRVPFPPYRQSQDCIRNGKAIGYVRISSADQNPERQLIGLPLEKMFIDKVSGKDTNRPQLQAVREYLRGGDHLYVHSLDRLARNLVDLKTIVTELTARGVVVVFVKERLEFSSGEDAMSNLLLSVMGAFAEFERALIRERQREGIALAKKRGIYKGRKPSLTECQIADLRSRAIAGEKKAALARAFKISRETVYQYLKPVAVGSVAQ